MNLRYTGQNEKIIQAVTIANKILLSPSFYDKIAEFAGFQYSTYTGQQVAGELKNSTSEIRVDTYWNGWFRAATAKTQTEININTAKLNRSMASIVNTLIHESVHFVDWEVNHNWDYTDRNEYENPPKSATYVIGDIAERLAPEYITV